MRTAIVSSHPAVNNTANCARDRRPIATCLCGSSIARAYDHSTVRSRTGRGKLIGHFNQVINGHDYWLQQEWSNRALACVPSNTFPQPTASFTWSPAAPTHGAPVMFTSSAGDVDDTTFTYAWSFGDFAISTTKNPTHTFSSAGTRAVTLVVTDPHGDQVRTVRLVAVT